jgi:homoserine dehydrogenase
VNRSKRRDSESRVTTPLNLAFVGFGLVARRFLELLIVHRQRLAAEHALGWRMLGVATARHGAALFPSDTEPRQVVAAAETGTLSHLLATGQGSPPETTLEFLRLIHGVDNLVVVENTPLGLDGGQPGVDHVRTALAGGADVITANKSPAAFAYRELRDLAVTNRCRFLFEGAVLDGLPVFSLLRHTLPALRVRGFRGIVNTTTNHVLSAMEHGDTIDDAVTAMQTAGVAEADPSKDIDGWDAAAKTAVLANALMDAEITPHDVDREGLSSVTVDDVQASRRNGKRIKIVASAKRDGHKVVAAARPVELDGNDPLAGLTGTAKGLELDTDLLGRIHISKPSSGVDHTAYALLADLVEVNRRRIEQS